MGEADFGAVENDTGPVFLVRPSKEFKLRRGHWRLAGIAEVHSGTTVEQQRQYQHRNENAATG